MLSFEIWFVGNLTQNDVTLTPLDRGTLYDVYCAETQPSRFLSTTIRQGLRFLRCPKSIVSIVRFPFYKQTINTFRDRFLFWSIFCKSSWWSSWSGTAPRLEPRWSSSAFVLGRGEMMVTRGGLSQWSRWIFSHVYVCFEIRFCKLNAGSFWTVDVYCNQLFHLIFMTRTRLWLGNFDQTLGVPLTIHEQ